jgi:hypothetical protein
MSVALLGEGRVAPRDAHEARSRPPEPALRRREGHAAQACHLGELSTVDEAKCENDAIVGAELVEDAVGGTHGFVELRSRARCFAFR